MAVEEHSSQRPAPVPLDLIDRGRVLALVSEHVARAWSSFDRPRPADPELPNELRMRLDQPLPEVPGDAEVALGDAAQVLDSSISPSRPLFAAYIGSTGIEAGVLASALTNVFRGWIETTLELARLLAAAVQADPNFELLHEPQLSTVCFRYLGSGSGSGSGSHPGAGSDSRSGARDSSELDALNLALAQATQADGRVYLAPAALDGHACLRVCFTNFRTRPEHVTELLSVVREIAAELQR